MPRTLIPFATGIHEEVDPKMLPEGNLKSITNLRVRRGSQLGVRFGYDTLGLVGEGAVAIIPSDILSFNGRLMALASTDGAVAPNDLVEYINQTGQDWRHSVARSDAGDDNGPRLNPVTDVRSMGRLPFQSVDTDIVDVAAANGLVCLVSTLTSTTVVQLIRASDDSQLFIDEITGIHSRVVAVGNTFFIVTQSGTVSAPTDTLSAFIVDPASSNSVTSHSTITTSPADLQTFDLVQNLNGGFTVVEQRGTQIQVLRFDSSGSSINSFTATGTTGNGLSVIEHPTGTPSLSVVQSIVIPTRITTYVSATGAVVAGPTNPSTTPGSPFSDRQAGLVTYDTGSKIVIFYGDDTGGKSITTVVINSQTHVAVSTLLDKHTWNGSILSSKPLLLPNTVEGDAIIFAGGFIDESLNVTNYLAMAAPYEGVLATLDRLTGLQTSFVQMPHLALDAVTGKVYWARCLKDADGFSTVVATEIEIAQAVRRQSAVANGELYLASGITQMYDGRLLTDCGYAKPPIVESATETTGGSLTLLATYQMVVVFEWSDSQGNSHKSPPSEVTEVTLTGSNNAINLVVFGPTSQRYNHTNDADLAMKVVVYRTLPSPEAQLHQDNFSFSREDFGKEVTVALTQADSTLLTQGVVYTQGATGSRSGPNPFVSPEPCRYIWASADKLLTGGLSVPGAIQESRAAFPAEPITWSGNPGGKREIRADVLAVASLDERRIVFTADELFQVDGEGLDINGVGDLGAARKLPSAVGLFGGRDGWRSLVESDEGLMFQGTTGLLYMLPRGGGAPLEVGGAVQDTLEAFPTITAATYCKDDQTVCFACNNVANDDAVILTYDIRKKQWSQDTEPGNVLALTHHLGKLIVLRGTSTIHQQKSAHPAAAFIDTEAITGTIHPFAHGMEGEVSEINFVGEYRGNCVMNAFLSNDDGLTEATLTAITVSNRTVGETVALSWKPDVMVGNRFRLRFTCTEDNGATEGMRYNYAVLHTTSANTEMLTDDADHG